MAKVAEQVQTAVDFVQTIADLKNGKALIDCSRKLTKLVAAVVDVKKKGKLTLQLLIEPAGVGDDGRITETSVSWQCSIVEPQPDTGRSVFFVTRDGRLSRNDPNQEELFGVEEVKAHG